MLSIFPRYLIDPSIVKKIHPEFDCIIIGSGIAGLSTAIRVAQGYKVKVLTKSRLSESTTWYAQGGIAAAIKKPDRWKTHYNDTIEAGQGLCDSSAVEKLVKKAPQMIEDLLEQGINFDISGGEISLTTEGGHSFPRVLHAGGDATGEEIENKLVKFSMDLKNIDFHSETLVADIFTTDNEALGVIAVDPDSGALEIHPSRNIVVASGGIGQLYEISTNPPISTGDGIAMAWRAGTAIKDIEFIQFHPTVFKTNNGHLFLITEALRGEGAYLRDPGGKRFMLRQHPKAELAPRDIVVKEMVKVMAKQKLDFIFLDATHIPESLLKVRFPNIISKLKENGLNLSTDLIKVFPAAHYLNGGIKTDLKGKTGVSGLYGCGEAAATGAHGANRLASNSLIEGLVFGSEIAKDILKNIKNNKSRNNDFSRDFEKILRGGIKGSHIMAPEPDNKPGIDNSHIEKIVADFRHMMSLNVGILRDEKSLNTAEDFIKGAMDELKVYNTWNKSFIELINMLNVGSLIIKAAKLRKESRGTHQRLDFPEKDDINWKRHIILTKDIASFEPVQ